MSDQGRGIAPALLRWYDRHRRDLPWRRETSPYRTLVSELMLQQTVVATVIPYFERFVARFPTLQALAAAREDEVTAAWSGLGYYARARNLHRTARAVVERHGGCLPGDQAALRELPGLGPYTAAAVAAIAFDEPVFALDGNAARVTARLCGETAPIATNAVRDRLRAVGQAWVPRRRAGDFAQAVMELGATVCGARVVRCDACPLRRMCRAYSEGRVEQIPAKTARPRRTNVELVCLRVRDGGATLLRRTDSGLLAGTWVLPARELRAGDFGVVAERKSGRDSRSQVRVAETALATQAARALARELGLRGVGPAPVGSIRHVFTHRDVTATIFEARARGSLRRGMKIAAPPAPWETKAADRTRRPAVATARARPAAATPTTWETAWVDEDDLGRWALSSFTRKMLRLVPDGNARPKRDKPGAAP